MKAVGLFRELEDKTDPSVQSIYAVVGALSADVADAVYTYLSNGEPVFDVMGHSRDPIDGSKFIIGGPSLVTDGVWIWRHDLEHFVKNYRVGLPDDFIHHIFNNKGKQLKLAVTKELCDEVLRTYKLAKHGKAPELG